jgi:hypothetical protein
LTETPHPHEVEPWIAARSIVFVDELADQEKGERLRRVRAVEPEQDRQVIAMPEPVGEGRSGGKGRRR